MPSSNFSEAFDPRGGGAGIGGSELIVVFATSDVEGNRLIFDRGSDSVLSVSYSSRNMAVVARRSDLVAATREALAELLILRPLDVNNVRVFDAQSVALVELPIDYAIFPLR